MGFLDKLTWKEYFLIGGLLIIWATVAFVSFNAFGNDDITTVGFALFIGVIATGVLLILIVMPHLYDHITLTLRFGCDQVMEYYEGLQERQRCAERQVPRG